MASTGPARQRRRKYLPIWGRGRARRVQASLLAVLLVLNQCLGWLAPAVAYADELDSATAIEAVDDAAEAAEIEAIAVEAPAQIPGAADDIPEPVPAEPATPAGEEQGNVPDANAPPADEENALSAADAAQAAEEPEGEPSAAGPAVDPAVGAASEDDGYDTARVITTEAEGPRSFGRGDTPEPASSLRMRGDSISGTAYDVQRDGTPYGTTGATFWVTIDGQRFGLECIDPYNYAPANGADVSYSGTYAYTSDGYDYYYVTTVPTSDVDAAEVAYFESHYYADGTPWSALMGGDSQRLAGYIWFKAEGYIALEKVSANQALTGSLSCYSLAGAVYGVYSDAACTELVATMTTDADGKAASEAISDGTYYVREISPSPGFLLDAAVKTVTVEPGQTATVTSIEQPGNDPMNARVVKQDAGTGVPLAGARFTLSYFDNTEGDVSGSPVRRWVFETNANGVVLFRSTTPVSGDAFFTGPGGTRVFPIGTYTIIETEAPAGYELEADAADPSIRNRTQIIRVTGDGQTVTEFNGGGDLVVGNIGFQTELTGGEGEKTVLAEQPMTLIDTVSYSGLEPGKTYTLTGELMDKETGEGTGIMSGEVPFTPTEPAGTVDVPFTFDGFEWMGHELVAFETLSRNGRTVIVHADLNDEGQTVEIPEIGIGTTLTDGDGNHEVLATEPTVLVDTVAYESLKPGKTYTLTGELMDKATGEGIGVTASTTFTPTEADGTAEVAFEIDPALIEGKTLVAFEELFCEGTSIAIHADIDDVDQTVTVPRIGTTLTDEDGGKAPVSAGPITLFDTIEYENLVAGRTYTVTGELMDKATGASLGITASARFTPAQAAGTVEIAFEIADASLLAGKTVVAFESVSHEGRDIAIHADIEDEGQTVRFPEISTTATGKNGGKRILASGNATVIDTVAYENLIPGKTYTMRGELHLRAADGSDAGVLLDASGKAVTAEASFTPAQADGTVEMVFTFDASLLAGRSVVVFESCYEGELLVAAHADISDAGQTVEFYKPSLPVTGDMTDVRAAALIGLAGAVAAAVGLFLANRRKEGMRA